MKRIFAGIAVVAISMLPMTGHAAPEGCALLAGQGEGSATITEAGAANGIVGGGSWTVTIVRGTETITHSRTHAAPEALPGALQAGDQITCSADEGFVVAGRA